MNLIISSIKNSNFIQFISCGLLQLWSTSRVAFWLLKHPSVCPIVTSQVLLMQHYDVTENNGIGYNVVIPLVEKFKLLMNINEWVAPVQSKQLTARSLNRWFAHGTCFGADIHCSDEGATDFLILFLFLLLLLLNNSNEFLSSIQSFL